jgi:hypothetical protein
MILRAVSDFSEQERDVFRSGSDPAESLLAMFSKPWFTKQIGLTGP